MYFSLHIYIYYCRNNLKPVFTGLNNVHMKASVPSEVQQKRYCAEGRISTKDWRISIVKIISFYCMLKNTVQ